MEKIDISENPNFINKQFKFLEIIIPSNNSKSLILS